MKTYISTASLFLLFVTFIGADDNIQGKLLTHEAIQGAWEMKGEDGSKRTKFIAGGQWTITQCDPETGTVIFHHGGTYSLDGSTYTETVVFANENTSNLKGDSHKFEITNISERVLMAFPNCFSDEPNTSAAFHSRQL